MRLRTDDLIERYKDHLYAAAYSVCRNPQDAEDAVQETLLRYHTTSKQFDDEQHP